MRNLLVNNDLLHLYAFTILLIAYTQMLVWVRLPSLVCQSFIVRIIYSRRTCVFEGIWSGVFNHIRAFVAL
jgi:hypothetical protein